MLEEEHVTLSKRMKRSFEQRIEITELGIGTSIPMDLCFNSLLHLLFLLLLVCSNLAMNQKNILGGELEPCSFDPLTGWFRDGYCR